MLSCGEDDQPGPDLATDNEVKVMIDGEMVFLSENNLFNQINRDKDSNGLDFFRISFFVDHVSESAYNANVFASLSAVNGESELLSPSNATNYIRYSDEDRPCTESSNYMLEDLTTIEISTDSDDLASGFLEFEIPFCYQYPNPVNIRIEFKGIEVDFN